MIFLLAIIFFLILFTVLVLIISDSVRGKGRFGINLKIPDCPGCGKKVPAVRKPKSANQAMWGGWTCESCGLELDKWGKPVSSNALPAGEPRRIEPVREIYIKPLDDRGKTPVERIFEDDEK